MCGINGFYKSSKLEDNEVENIVKMNAKMRYRGPDDNDVWACDTTVLGQTRLSIIGVSNGKQPIVNEDATMVIVCNGEVYNYKELKEDLIKKGHIFSTDTDSEVILHLYEDKKEKMLDDLRGMFAIAIYNKLDNSLFLARDINGKKPLYYSQLLNGLVFSSEITAIKEFWLSDADLNIPEVKDYLKHSYSQSMEKTWINQIEKVEPGQYLFVKNNQIHKRRYYKKTNNPTFKGTYQEAKEKCLEILQESVALRLQSEVPVAVLLSGGIDSSAIAALASKASKKPIHAITVGYKGTPNCDERALAKKTAEDNGLIWHEIELDASDFQNEFYEYMQYLDEPNGDMAAIAQWAIYKKAKALGFKVLLSGNGGDELFYGYPVHNEIAKNMITVENINKTRKKISTLLQPKKTLKQLSKTIEHYKTFYHAGYSKLNHIFENNFTFNQDNHREKYYNDEPVEIEKVYSYLFNVWLSNNCYYLSDKLAMAHSIEMRCPFADRALIDFVATLPLEYKFKNNEPKGFLKDILSGVVLDEVLYGKKRGFTPPNSFIGEIIQNHKPKYFLNGTSEWTQVVVDEFLGRNLK